MFTPLFSDQKSVDVSGRQTIIFRGCRKGGCITNGVYEASTISVNLNLKGIGSGNGINNDISQQWLGLE